MFYEGSLQSGIASAVDQQKLVFAFVTDGNDESNTWENEYLQDESVIGLIKSRAVALRLQAGSEEAGYLAQIIPLPQTPTIVIMKHGELKEYIAPGTTKEDFLRRVQNTFNVTPSSQQASSPPARPTPAETATPAPVPVPTPTPARDTVPAAPAPTVEAVPAAAAAEAIVATPAPASEPSTSTTPAQPDHAANVRRILAERVAKMQKVKEESAQQAKEKAASESKREAEAQAARTQEQAELVKKKRLKETEERQRILKRIEEDKARRKLQAAEREKKTNEAAGEDAATEPITTTPLPSFKKPGVMTSLQVRLFDGATIRSRFETVSSLKDVRTWIDANRTDEKLPYTLKQVLTPVSNKNIDVTEESQSLGDLGLAPSSTLVLVPVQKFASAYVKGNPFTEFFGFILRFFTWLLSLIGISGGDGTPQPAAAQEQVESSDAAEARARRVRGLQNADDRRRDQQLYNGNSLNFEPRPDEDDR